MAQNLQLLKRRIRTSKNIAQIAKAMEMISASKIKRSQTASQNNKPYAERITTMTSSILSIIKSSEDNKISHPYLKSSENTKTLLIAISPDRGSCGSLNTNLFKKMMEMENENPIVITVGKKAGIFAAKLGFELVASFPIGSSLPDYSLTYQLKNIIDEELNSGKVGKVTILYADFVSLFIQSPVIKKLLPLEIETTEDIPDVIESSLFEPASQEILSSLLPYYLEAQIYNALLQAFTSEQAARMVAMQNAKNNANDIAEYLNLVYNRSRQERITNEILDLSNSKQV